MSQRDFYDVRCDYPGVDERLADALRHGDPGAESIEDVSEPDALAYLRTHRDCPPSCPACNGLGDDVNRPNGSVCPRCGGNGALLDDPLPLPLGWTDDDLLDDVGGPVSPTSLAASWRAGQRHVDAIRRSEPVCPSQVPGRARSDPGPRLVVRPDTPRYWEDEQREQAAEAWGTARMLVYAVLLVAFCAVGAWLFWQVFGR